MRRCNMAPIRGLICIDLKEVQSIRVFFFRNRINRQNTRLEPNGIGHFFLDCNLIGRQLRRINHQLRNTHNLFCRWCGKR